MLSSTIIREVSENCGLSHDVAVAYFYFDFNDSEKQRSDKMVRSLIVQLFGQSAKESRQMESAFSSCINGQRQPDTKTLMRILKEIMESLTETYVILDALDECSDRQELLESIKEIQECKSQRLHMLLTSRRLTDIEEMLEPLISPQDRICIQSVLVDEDISIYIHERLKLSPWRKKPEVRNEIETKLMEKADGM